MALEMHHRYNAILALDIIQERAEKLRKVWRGSKPPTMQEVDKAIHDLSRSVGVLKNYRSIRIQIARDAEKDAIKQALTDGLATARNAK